MRLIILCAVVFLVLVPLSAVVIASCEPSEVASEKNTGEEAETSTAAPEEAPSTSYVTMSLSIPKLGISDVPVVDVVSEEGLSRGVGHMPETGFPWQKGSNTWIAGHRLGYPGTPSDHIFFNLPSLAPGDEFTLSVSSSQVYRYQVSEILQLYPTEIWAMEPIPGRDVVSLQTCIENFGDFATLGPNWNVRLIVRGDRVD